MKKEHKKKLLIASLIMTGTASILTGCNKAYKKFVENADYKADENGIIRISGYVSSDSLDEIYIHLDKNNNSIYFVNIKEDIIPEFYEIFSNTRHDQPPDKCESLGTLYEYVSTKGYEIKEKYTEEDLRNLYDDFLNDYIEKKKEEIKQLELIQDNKE